MPHRHLPFDLYAVRRQSSAGGLFIFKPGIFHNPRQTPHSGQRVFRLNGRQSAARSIPAYTSFEMCAITASAASTSPRQSLINTAMT